MNKYDFMTLMAYIGLTCALINVGFSIGVGAEQGASVMVVIFEVLVGIVCGAFILSRLK